MDVSRSSGGLAMSWLVVELLIFTAMYNVSRRVAALSPNNVTTQQWVSECMNVLDLEVFCSPVSSRSCCLLWVRYK